MQKKDVVAAQTAIVTKEHVAKKDYAIVQADVVLKANVVAEVLRHAQVAIVPRGSNSLRGWLLLMGVMISTTTSIKSDYNCLQIILI